VRDAGHSEVIDVVEGVLQSCRYELVVVDDQDLETHSSFDLRVAVVGAFIHLNAFSTSPKEVASAIGQLSYQAFKHLNTTLR